MGFSRQEYCSGLPFPQQGIFLTQESNPCLLCLLTLQASSLPRSHLGMVLPKQEVWVQFLSQEDPLEKGMATHSSILPWEIPWTEEPGGLQPMGSKRVGRD